MPDEDITEAVTYWLTKQLPGGQWILPHWQEGLFWLVPVSHVEDANRFVEVLGRDSAADALRTVTSAEPADLARLEELAAECALTVKFWLSVRD